MAVFEFLIMVLGAASFTNLVFKAVDALEGRR